MSNAVAQRLPAAALAFRGYNQTNLGRTPELFAVGAYRPILEWRLEEASRLCAEVTGRKTDLARFVSQREEPGWRHYAESVALVFAVELAQLDLMREVHHVDLLDARLAFGYSLGELAAVSTAGLFASDAVLRVPLSLADDCVEMSRGVTMAVMFSRQKALKESAVFDLCEEITAEGKGSIAISAILSPNTVLVIGEADALDQLRARREEICPGPIQFRKNDGVWPPLHTSLVREKHIPDRASLMIRDAPRLAKKPRLPIWSLVTGQQEYEESSGREVLRRWVDSPQRLWDVVEGSLAADVRTVIHIGPEPNVIPATFRRLAENVMRQTLSWSFSSVGMRTMQQAAHSAWLAPLLPRSGCLLRAPRVEHIILEDWLLENAPA